MKGYDFLMPALIPEPTVDLDSRTLRIVRAIDETGSITAAAAALGYSQPAVSQQLKRAEQRIGLTLVSRAGRGVRLTEAGRVLVRHARVITAALDSAAGELADLAGLRAGRVRLAGFPSASPTLVPQLLGRIASEHPGIGIGYLEAEPPEAIEAVRAQQADLAITFSYPGDRDDPYRDNARGLVSAALWRDEMLVALPADHLQADSRSVRLADLSADSWIAGCPRCRGHLLQLTEQSGFEPRIAYETDNFVAVLGMVAAGLGVALVPALAIDATSVPPGVVIRSTSNRDYRTVHLVGAVGSDQVPAIAATASAITDLDTSAWSLSAVTGDD
jgi:molybdate transport repressor ModE-like protein